MYKKFETSWIKHIDFLIIDLFSLQTAFTLAYLLAFYIFNWDPSYFEDYYLQISVMLVVANGCAAFLDEGYHNILRRGYLQEAKANAKHILLIMAMMMAYFYITRQIVRINPVFFLMMTLFSLVLTYGLRTGYKALYHRNQLKNPEQSYQMMVLTSQKRLQDVLEGLNAPACQVCGICLADAKEGSISQYQGTPVVCDMKNLLDYIKEHVVDGLFIDLPDSIPLPDVILSTCATMGVSTHLGLARKDYAHQGEVIERIGEYTVLTRSVRVATVRQLFLKRAIDICAGLAGVVVTGICFLFVAPMIYLASPGPIFFSQTRVGKNGRLFKIYKFRSMYMDAEERKQELMKQNKIADGMMFKMDDDPRIIKGIGHFIRDYSIDELPQLWNVLKGEMSLIGTRPPTVNEYEKYKYHHKIRLAIKPGITGMWQVSGRSNITDFEQVVDLDASYITNWSLGLDFKILLKTIKVVLKKDGAA